MMQLLEQGMRLAAFQTKGNPIFLVLGVIALIVGFIWIQRDKKKKEEEKQRLKNSGEHNPKGTGAMFDENPRDTRIKRENLKKGMFTPKAVKKMQEEEAEREKQAKHIYTPEEIGEMLQEEEAQDDPPKEAEDQAEK